MASTPVAEVNRAGKPVVNWGTRAAYAGISFGCPNTTFVPDSSDMTALFPPSLPVPAVVGMAATNGIRSTRPGFSSTCFENCLHLFLMKSGASRAISKPWSASCSATKAIPPFAASRGPPPPTPTAESHSCFRKASAIPTTSLTPGFGTHLSNMAGSIPFAAMLCLMSSIKLSFATPSSVTSNGRLAEAWCRLSTKLSSASVPAYTVWSSNASVFISKLNEVVAL
mmetsp:Transcript_22290/g.43353  ORF Transcript_22290/g.43353 Transcript_22290/m.43353 type:complete len:225 (-) Transcript_22290:117-791(-)